ncbi:MAG TPA: hypothetical protein PLK82_05025, partial [Bacteroidales bacterium]|nr:hypothetical protein [Bacteroidales bacterium]
MKNIYISRISRKTGFLIIMAVLSIAAQTAFSQVRKAFAPRTSVYSPLRTIYNIHGDYTMIGNTNMTLSNYGNNTNNSNNNMVVVDKDGISGTTNSSSATLSIPVENGSTPSCSNIIYAGLYWTGRTNDYVTTTAKRTIKMKGPGQSAYTTFVANSSDLQFPGDNNMYAGYIEVTDLVKTCGLGQYWVADIAVTTGDGGSTGYYGGWGLVVVYENSKMKLRDITVFDGYAYVEGNAVISHELPVSGFNAVPAGNVSMKLGMMAGEGDVGISGDYFQIKKLNTGDWLSLNHDSNSVTNFFNSSIFTGNNARNPWLRNNTGVDISMFQVPNPNNTVIANNQTTTTFKYGSTQDTYIIFCIAMGVDAYSPDIEGIVSTSTINGVPVTGTPPYSAQPGQEIEYKVEIRNKGTEPVNNTRIVVPLPFASTYVSSSKTVYTPASSTTSPYFDASLGATGSIVWDFGTLPLPTSPYNSQTLLGVLTFKVKTTEDCSILTNANCIPLSVSVTGTISGTGAITNIAINSKPLIQGYSTVGNCQGEPITNPIVTNINGTGNCSGTPPIPSFTYCNVGSTIPITQVSGNFPAGSRFYNEYPLVEPYTEYTISNPFPATSGTTTYYAIPPGATSCYFTFTISVSNVTTTPTVSSTPVEYCQGATAVPLTATATPHSPAYTLYYYTENTAGASPQLSITPSTTTAGTFTYYVAEGISNQCISPNKAPITVIVHGTPSCSISGPAGPVCPGSSNTYTSAPAGMTSYTWSISGNGSIPNPSTGQSVTVTAGSNCNQSYTLSVVIKNQYGCQTSCSKTVNVLDNTPPQWTTSAGSLNRTISCSDAAGMAAAQALYPVATDNCDANVTNIVKVSGGFVPGSTCSQAGTYTNTWTVADDCGNVSAVYTQVITVTDNTAPQWTTAAGSLNRTVSCSDAAALATARALYPVATDNCDANVTNIVKVSGGFVAGSTCSQ